MKEDEELKRLREQRKKELEESVDSEEEAIEQQRQELKSQASKYLTKDAKERLGNVRVAKPELASAVEAQIAQLGRMGRIEKMGDDELKNILKEVQKSEDKDTDIKFRR